MTISTFAAEVDAAVRHIKTGALLLRLVASRIGKNEPGLEASLPEFLGFIADGILDHAEILHYAAEDAAASPEKAS